MKHAWIATIVIALLAGACRSAPEPVAAPLEITDELRALAAYRFGDSREHVSAVETRVRTADAATAAELESEMIWLLDADDATFAARQFACRVLRRVGTARSVPALAALLDDVRLSHPARFALQGMGTPDAGAALRDALARVDGDLRLGVIDSIAAREDRGAVPLLAQLLDEGDEGTVRACLSALGRIGGTEAARAIAGADIGAALPVERYDAQLRCAEAMVDDGDVREALELLHALAGAGNPTACRVAACRGIVRAAPGEALDAIAEWLFDEEPALQRAAASLLVGLPASVDTTPLARKLWTYPASARIPALEALALRGGESARRAAAEALTDEEEAVRIAGLRATGLVGDARSVGSLVSFATRPAAEAAAARSALERLRGEGVDEALLQILREANEETRAGLLSCLVARRSPGAVNALLGFCARGTAPVRVASLRAIGQLAGEEDLSRMLLLLGGLEHEEERALLGDALAAACRRADEEEQAAAFVVRALGDWGAPQRTTLLRVLGELPSDTTLAPLVWVVENEKGESRLAALQALANWPDQAPCTTLREAYFGSTDPAEREHALHGYLRLSAFCEPEFHPVHHQEALAGAATTSERLAVIESAAGAGTGWAMDFLRPLLASEEDELKYAAERAFRGLSGRLARGAASDAVGATVTLTHAPVERYTPEGDSPLTDGVWGSTDHTDGKWLGFQGDDLRAVVDLGRSVQVENLRLGALDSRGSWIFGPLAVKFELSADGTTWAEPTPRAWSFDAAPADDAGRMSPARAGTHGYWLAEPTAARYVRVTAEGVGILPEWHPGSGEEGWLFVDELAVNPRYGE